MTDREDKLAANPFAFTVNHDRVRISRGGKTVTTLGASAWARFLAAAAGANEAARQQLMARATGNYKRGNERQRGARGRSRRG